MPIEYDMDYFMSLMNKENTKSNNTTYYDKQDKKIRLREEDTYDGSKTGDVYHIEEEVDSISTAEEELMRKARDLEHEMRAIRVKKMEVVLKQFEAQLHKEAHLQLKKHTEELRDKYEAQVAQVEAERLASVTDIDKMQKSLIDQIEFFKVVY